MKKNVKSTAVTLALLLLLSITVFAEPGFAYGEDTLNSFAPKWNDILSDETVISLTPGACAGEIRFAWLSDKNDSNPKFMISKNSDMSEAEEIAVTVNSAADNRKSNKVTVSGLEEGKTYYYTYTENGKMSEPQAVTVQPSNEFTVLYISDAQIGRSGDEELEEILIRDTCGWNYTVEKMITQYPNAAFAISGGDQFQSADSITQMKAYLSPTAMRSLPFANTIGNHDKDSTLYGDIFNNPNEVKETFAVDAGSGYYYTYGDALFITINSNNESLTDTARVLRQATQAHPDTKWRIVTMHHNPYSASHDDSVFSDRRLLFASLYDCYDIDLCLSGHDHIYSRTHIMYAGKITNSEGTVYVQSSSASGSNYDSLPDNRGSFTVQAFDERIPTYTALTFTNDGISGTTYRTDTDEIIDTFEISDNTTNSKTDIFSIIASIFKTLFSMI